MNSQDQMLVKYVGGMFFSIVGGHMPELRALNAAYGGNLRAMMSDLSQSPVWAGTTATGTTRDVAHDLVNRLVGSTAAAADREWAVNWFTDQKDGGATWGEILYQAFSALDAIDQGAWAASATAFRERAAYNAEATESWAANVYDLHTMRDVFSAAVVPATFEVTPYNGDAITGLQAAAGALGVAAASLASAGAGVSYTVSSSDVGKALMMGDGDDTVAVSWAHLDKLPLISGGGGDDRLIINGSPDDIVTFMNTYAGVYESTPIRGFETIQYEGYNPMSTGAIDGVRQIVFDRAEHGNDLRIAGVDNATTFNFDLTPGRTNYVRFQDTPSYHTYQPSMPAPLTPQVVDRLTFNLKASAESKTLFLTRPPAKDLQVNIEGPADNTLRLSFSAVSDVILRNELPWLERLGISGLSDLSIMMTAPAAREFDFTGSGTVRLSPNIASPLLADGVRETITVQAPNGPLAWAWTSTAQYLDTTMTFEGVLRAGSSVKVLNLGELKVEGLPTVKAVFGADFSDANVLVQTWGSDTAGSVFDVQGWQTVAVEFKGVAPAGQNLGTVSLSRYQTTYVKVESAAGLNFVNAAGADGSIAVVINDGSGSILANAKEALQSQMFGLQLQWMDVAGGRILWGDVDSSGGLTGPARWPWTSWESTQDILFMETSSATFDQFAQSVGLMGFQIENPFVI